MLWYIKCNTFKNGSLMALSMCCIFQQLLFIWCLLCACLYVCV